MAENLGKKFEQKVREGFEQLDGVSIDRVHDQTTRYKGSTNICDFVVYRCPALYYIECKSVHGNTLSIHSVPKPDKKGVLHGFYGNITDAQWEGLLKKSEIPGVVAGVMCWWVDAGLTRFLPIQLLKHLRDDGFKSVRCDLIMYKGWYPYDIKGVKKRKFYDYDMGYFLDEVRHQIATSKIEDSQRWRVEICCTK